MAENPRGVAYDDEPVTVCDQGAHEWAEGDEGAVYCDVCTGYCCHVCNGRGWYRDPLAKKKCYACGGFGVEMGWPDSPYRLNPHNWAAATAAQLAASGEDQDAAPSTGKEPT